MIPEKMKNKLSEKKSDDFLLWYGANFIYSWKFKAATDWLRKLARENVGVFIMSFSKSALHVEGKKMCKVM